MNRSDPTIMLIFDDAGYIAGIQISFYKKLVDEKYYPFSTADPLQVSYKIKNYFGKGNQDFFKIFFRKEIGLEKNLFTTQFIL
jgi:hypothetical protein